MLKECSSAAVKPAGRISHGTGRGRRGSWRYRGSFTVEAALLMSVILMVLFLVIQMTLFLTDTVSMTALLAEQTWGTDARGTGEAADSRGEEHFFYLDAGRVLLQEGSSSVKASYPDSRISLGYGVRPEICLEQERKLRDPVKYLWRVRQVLDLVGRTGNES